MKIIAGIARGVELAVPPGLDVRPTPDRVRKALCDSLHEFAGLAVADFYAGSGAFGLEAASRGAAAVLLVEKSRRQLGFLQKNLDRVSQSGVTARLDCCCAEVAATALYRGKMPRPNLIFADPPYAESAEEFAALMKNTEFRRWAQGATLIWELPSAPHSHQPFAEALPGLDVAFRRHEGFNFLVVSL